MLSFAAALWLLHSVVPHVHDSNEVGIVSEWDTHTSNFLQSLFGVDLGDDHLEEFSFVDGAAPALAPSKVVVEGSQLVIETRRSTISITPAFSDRRLTRSQSRRGPPTA